MKRDPTQEEEVLDWMEAVLGEKLDRNKPYEDLLRDGVLLCKLMNKIKPGAVKRIQERGTNFQLMENVQRFQAAIRAYGVPDEEIFQTADLFERRNIAQVTLGIYALGRVTQLHEDYSGPPLGPKIASSNKRNFSAEAVRQMRDAEVGLQAGHNRGATQAGQNMGNTRHM